ncbi:MAG: class I SAM-dependent methyltransferase [Erysipelotrichaceae bacterium]|nr:class I SAM-dependent methyltransferase [Erysipelotrichaceae bacterium]
MITSTDFKDYRLLDSGDREKLESWAGIILRRPDPMAIWPKQFPDLWNKCDAVYYRSSQGGGHWEYNRTLPKQWNVKYKDLVFKVSPTDFKHTGLFPEQASNWDFITRKVKEGVKAGREVRILNLFAYTGAATMAASAAGAAEVVHVDAAKGMVQWAKENMQLSGLQDHKIRFIVDDCLKFVRREQKRGRKYDGILMDPPSYGRGPNNELFRFEDQINVLIEETLKLLSDDPLFYFISSYTTGYSCEVMKNVMNSHLAIAGFRGKADSQELGIPIENSDFCLPCGIVTRYDPRSL